MTKTPSKLLSERGEGINSLRETWSAAGVRIEGNARELTDSGLLGVGWSQVIRVSVFWYNIPTDRKQI